MDEQKIKIVIVGGGFGGLTCALKLREKLSPEDFSITLVDKRDYHVFNPSLYEVATAEEEFTSVQELTKSAAIPFKEITKGKGIDFMKGELREVSQPEKRIHVSGKVLHYDYLVLALGSQVDFFGIPGAEEYAIPFKTLTDSFRIRNAVEFLVQRGRDDTKQMRLRLVIAGGGYTGVELAGELAGFLDIVAWKNNFPREQLEVLVVEGAFNLIPGLDKRVGRDALSRLTELKVRTQLGSFVAKVTSQHIELSNAERLEYDLLAWTTGIKAVQPQFTVPVALGEKMKVMTNGYLQVEGEDAIFMIGDESCILDSEGKPAPSTAQDAMRQAEYLAYALPLLIQNRRPNGFACEKHGIIVAIGGKWAIGKFNKFYFTGFFPYVLKRVADFRYFASLVGSVRAFRYLWMEVNLYTRNDK
jgi:NADH:ubiquinone reductase (H+-translocating)